MKTSFLIVILTLFFASFPASAAEDIDCAAQLNSFYGTKGTINNVQRERLEICKSYCEEVPNFKKARKLCGIDDCKIQLATTGKVSPWCCRISKIWGDKSGVVTDPALEIKDACQTQQGSDKDFLVCVDTLKNNGTLSDACCTITNQINRYDPVLGKQAYKYCSEKTSANICIDTYRDKGEISLACCNFSSAVKGEVGTSPFFKDAGYITEVMTRGLDKCQYPTVNYDESLNSCLARFKKDQMIIPECCDAYKRGLLIPSSRGMNYAIVDRYCSPAKY